jgi:hypothetical protein
MKELIPNHAFTKRRKNMGPDVDEKEFSEQNEDRIEDPNTEAFVFPFPDKPDWCGPPFFPALVEDPVAFPDGCSTPLPPAPVDKPPDWLIHENAHFPDGSSIEFPDQRIDPYTCTG